MIPWFRDAGRRLPFLTGVFLLICAAGVFGQEGTSDAAGGEVFLISSKDAVEMAIKSNLSLEAARLTLDTKKRKSDLVWNQFLPTVNATGTLARDNWPSSTAGVNFATMQPYSMELPQWHAVGALSATLDFSFALIAGIKSIKLDYEAGQVTLEKARLQMEREIRKTYNQILLLEENAELLRGSYANAQNQSEAAEANYRAGLAPRLSWLQAQVAVENMKPSISEMENSLKALKGNFSMSLGLPYDTEFTLEPVPPGGINVPLDLRELISRAVSGKPDIVELQKQIAALASGRKAQALQLFTPFLRFSWDLTSTYTPTLDPFKEGFFTMDNWNKGGSFSLTLGISLNGLLPFTKEGQALKDMDNQLKELNILMAQAVQGTELEIFTKLNSLQKTLDTQEAQRGAVELADLSYRLTEEAYHAGLQDFQSVQGAALALDQAKLQLVTQQFNYFNDLIDLEYAVGVPFGALSSAAEN